MPSVRLPLTLAALLFLVTAIAGFWQAPASAAPKPALVSKSWSLNVTYETPRPIAVKGLDGEYKWWWYMTYKVVNETDEDQVFVPRFEILNDQGDIIQANDNLPAYVFEAIKKKERNELLEKPERVLGKLLQGENYAKESVIVWPASEENLTELTIFLGGFDGEVHTETIEVPASEGKKAEKKEFTMTKQLMLKYRLPGNPETPQTQEVIFEGKEWILR